MSNENKTEINWIAIIIAAVCFVNMYWAFSGKWGLRPKEQPEPVLGFLCFIAGLVLLFVAFSKKTE
jgi:cytochrome c oxidase assembly factor CtaG